MNDNTKSILDALYPQRAGLTQIPFARGTDEYLSTGLFEPDAPRTVEACSEVVSLLFDADAVTLYRSDRHAAGLAPFEKVADYKRAMYQMPPKELRQLLGRLNRATLDALTEIIGLPTARVFSGWGLHYYYCVAPEIATEKARLSAIHQHIQRQVGARVVATTGRADLEKILDPTHDVGARVARRVGSWNRRAAHLPRQCVILDGDATRRITAEELQRIEGDMEKPQPKRKPAPSTASTPTPTTAKAPSVLDWTAYSDNGQTWEAIADSLGDGQVYKVVCPFGGTSKGSGFIKRTSDGRAFYRSHPLSRTYWKEQSGGRADLKQKRNADGETTGPAHTISNVYRLLQQDDGVDLWFDAFRQRPMFGDVVLDIPRAQTAIRRHAQDRYGWTMRVSREDVAVAMVEVAEANSQNPLEHRARATPWDGIARLHKWIPDVLGVEESALYSAIGRRWFISIAARICRPGCKVDTMLIIQGRQGTYKSELFKTIAGYLGEDLVLDTRLDWSNTTKSRHLLAGRLFYEDAELMSMQRASGDELKNLLSSRTDSYIPPFGRAEVSRPRTALIVGTTNNREILSDQTGARRFWIIDAERSPYVRADLGALRQLLPQLFAEALHCYDKGEQWWLTDEEQDEADRENEARTETDPLLEAARQVFSYSSGGIENGFTGAEFIDALGVRQDTVRDKRLTAKAVSAILQTAGFLRGRTYRHGQQIRVYYRPDKIDEDQYTGLQALNPPAQLRSNCA
jgi:hypothetical protein